MNQTIAIGDNVQTSIHRQYSGYQVVSNVTSVVTNWQTIYTITVPYGTLTVNAFALTLSGDTYSSTHPNNWVIGQ
jgi:hypothetical protein